MYRELLDVNKDGNALKNEPFIKTLPKMYEVYKDKQMGTKMVQYIVCYCDYKSPYAFLPVDEKRKEICQNLWGKTSNARCSHKKVKEAMDEYNRLQYDAHRHQYIVMTQKLHDLTVVYESLEATEENFKKLNDMQLQLDKSSLARDNVKKLIKKDMESETNLFGTDVASLSIMESKLRREDE